MRHAGRDAAYTPVDRLGNALNGAELEMSVEQMAEQMLVEICNQAHEVVAMTSVTLEEMWQVGLCQQISTCLGTSAQQISDKALLHVPTSSAVAC